MFGLRTCKQLLQLLLLPLLLLLSEADGASSRKGIKYKVHCEHNSMKVEMVKTPDMKSIYLEHLKIYPDESCHPKIEGDMATFNLDLKDIYKCMVTRVRNRGTGQQVYYHRVIVEHEDEAKMQPKSVFVVKCDSEALINSTSYDTEVEEVRLAKRSAQFDNWREHDIVDITGEVTGRAPTPELIVGVRQNNLLVGDELTVKPGTPLEMSVELDDTSSDIYGVMVSNMRVSDTRDQEEILILNGCTVDPYLFQNFETSDGDRLRAQFKAFKFPESNFVLFKGTVSVCLDRCRGVDCSNGQIGYGRRRRRDVTSPGDPNKVYEVSMSTVVKVAEEHVEGKPEQVWVEKATLREIGHEEASISALSEQFGTYKYVEFDQSIKNSAQSNNKNIILSITAALLSLRLLLW